jgi:biopolymer transport protein ExbD
MSMKAADSETNLTNEPNVTPMIDVLLVLLIIFMMVIPLSRRAIDLQLPDPNPAPTTATPSNQQIVLEVMPNQQYALNKRSIPRAVLFDSLKSVYEGRPEKILFIKGDPTVKYQEIIWAMDQARGAGVLVIGAAPKDKEPTGGGE